MDPVVFAFQIDGTERVIGSYGVMLAAAMLVGATLSTRAAYRARMDPGAVLAALGLAIAGALAGAWALFVAVEWIQTGSPLSGIQQGGLVFFGAPIGGFAALFAACRRLRLPFARLVDLSVPGIAAAHALGRIGCFLAGCCFGRAYDGPLSVIYTHPIAPAAHPPIARHAVPLYESAGLLVLAFVFALVPARSVGSGRRLAAYLAAYSALRIAIELLRGDAVRGLYFGGAVSTSQLVAGAIFAAALLWLARGRKLRARLVGAVAGALLLVAVLGAPRRGSALELRPSRGPIAWIPSGWFVMGADARDLAYAVHLCALEREQLGMPTEPCDTGELFEDESPDHRVYTSAYGIDRTEVTNAQYRRCIARNACPPSRLSDSDPRVGAPSHPVAGITWAEAAHYCAFARGRLPSEAEWERAARGATERRFPWGRFYNDRVANHGASGLRPDAIDGHRYAAPVGSYPDGASFYGLLDLAGNVWEWTADAYVAHSYQNADRIDPRGPPASGMRIVRGGSWQSPAYALRVTNRAFASEGSTAPDLGFRCAYDPVARR